MLPDDNVPLSTRSRLNHRYLSPSQGEHARATEPDISELSPVAGNRGHPAWQKKLGLSASALNDRYFDGADCPPANLVTEKHIEPQDKFSARPLAARPDFKYPRHPKSKRAAGSQRGGRGGEYVRSSAMSDCSEAPSLASHVRNVKVPSHTADLDQFLDELFEPVLDQDDGLSDARSLAASLKGRNRDFDDDSLIEAMSDPVRLSRKIKGMLLEDEDGKQKIRSRSCFRLDLLS